MLELIIKLVLALVPACIFIFLSTALGTIGVLYALAILIVGSAVVVCHKISQLKETIEKQKKDNETGE